MKDLFEAIANWKNFFAVGLALFAAYLIQVRDAGPFLVLIVICLAAVHAIAAVVSAVRRWLSRPPPPPSPPAGNKGKRRNPARHSRP